MQSTRTTKHPFEGVVRMSCLISRIIILVPPLNLSASIACQCANIPQGYSDSTQTMETLACTAGY